MCIMDNILRIKTTFVLYVIHFTLPGFTSYFEMHLKFSTWADFDTLSYDHVTMLGNGYQARSPFQSDHLLVR